MSHLWVTYEKRLSWNTFTARIQSIYADNQAAIIWAATWKKKNNNKVTVRPAKNQISLDTYPVWSESSLCA